MPAGSSAKNPPLQISYIGMQTQEVAIRPHVRVIMKSDNEMLTKLLLLLMVQQVVSLLPSLQLMQLMEMRPVTEVSGTLEGAVLVFK